MHCKPIAVALLTLLFTTNQVKGQFNALGSWDSHGVPDYLIVPDDEITSDFLEFINVSLPEQTAVPEHNPGLLVDQVAELHIHDSTELFLSFAHEGAGWLNSLAFYTYTPDDIPTEAPAEDELTLIFPNSSYAGSGGGLNSGNKVSLGTYPGGTCIGFALVARGWKNHLQNVTNQDYMLYSDPLFNPESDSTLRQHCITMFDDITERIVIGFEDIHREWGSCDHDFNDVLFYASASNPSAFAGEDYSPLDQNISTCYSTPEDLGVEDIKLYKTTCTWNSIEDAEAYRIRFRKWNSVDPWEYRNAGSDTSFVLGSIIPLQPATYYEWQIATTCDGIQTHNSEKHVFQTLTPCEMPAGLTTLNISGSAATMVWTPVPDIEHYILRFREIGETDWEWRNLGSDNFYLATDLDPNTAYEWSVNSFCSVVISCFGPYGSHKQFVTSSNLTPEMNCEDETNYRTFEDSEHFGTAPYNGAQIADLNHDNVPELIQFNSSRDALLIQSIVNSELGSITEIALNTTFSSFELDDQNGDDLTDIVLIDIEQNAIKIMAQQPESNMNFTAIDLQLETEFSAIGGFAQMTANTSPHLIYANQLTDAITISSLPAEGDEQRLLDLNTQTEYFAGSPIAQIVTRDLNVDHQSDLIAIHQSPELSIILNRLNADTMPFVRASYILEAPIETLEVIDLNGDRRQDLIYTLQGIAGLWYQQNVGEEHEMIFTNPEILLPIEQGSIFKSHKANDGGRTLIATAHSTEMEIAIWELLNHSSVLASDPYFIGTTTNIDQFWIQDINADSRIDIIYSEDSATMHFALGEPEELSQTTVLELSDNQEEITIEARKGTHYEWYVEQNKVWTSIEEGDLPFTSVDNKLTGDFSTFEGISSIKCLVSMDLCDERKYSHTFEIDKTRSTHSSLKVYPNPAREFVNVEYTHPESGQFTLAIYRMDGSVQMQQSFSKNSGMFHVQLGISDLNPGPYLLTVTRVDDRKSTTFTVVR